MLRTFARAQADLQKELALEGHRDARLRQIHDEFHDEIRRLRCQVSTNAYEYGYGYGYGYGQLNACIYNLYDFYRRNGSVQKDSELRVAYAQFLVFVRDDVVLREHVARIIEYLELNFSHMHNRSLSSFYREMGLRQNMEKMYWSRKPPMYSHLLAVLIRLDLRADDVIACRVDGPDTLGPLRDVLVGAPPAHAWIATIRICFYPATAKAVEAARTHVFAHTAHAMAEQATIQRACYVLSLRPVHAVVDEPTTQFSITIARNLTLLQPMGFDSPRALENPDVIAAAALEFDASNHLLLALLLVERREEASPIDGVAATCMPSDTLLNEVILASMSASGSNAYGVVISNSNRDAITCCCRGLMQHPLLLAALPTTYSVFNGMIANALSMICILNRSSGHVFAYDKVVDLTILPEFEASAIVHHSRVLFLPPWSPVGVPRCAWTDVPFVRTCMPFAGASDAIYQREALRAESEKNEAVTLMVLESPGDLGSFAHREAHRMCAAADATWLALSPYTPHWMTQSIEALHAGWAADASITIDAAIAQMYVRGKYVHKQPYAHDKDWSTVPAHTELTARIALELSLARSPPPSLMSAMYDISVRAQSLAIEIEQIMRAAPQLDPGRLIDMSVGAWSTSDMYRYVHGGKLDALRAAYAAITHAQAQAQAHTHAGAVPIDTTMSVA